MKILPCESNAIYEQEIHENEALMLACYAKASLSPTDLLRSIPTRRERGGTVTSDPTGYPDDLDHPMASSSLSTQLDAGTGYFAGGISYASHGPLIRGIVVSPRPSVIPRAQSLSQGPV